LQEHLWYIATYGDEPNEHNKEEIHFYGGHTNIRSRARISSIRRRLILKLETKYTDEYSQKSLGQKPGLFFVGIMNGYYPETSVSIPAEVPVFSPLVLHIFPVRAA